MPLDEDQIHTHTHIERNSQKESKTRNSQEKIIKMILISKRMLE